MPASTSLSSTLDRVDFTSGSRVTGLTVMLAFLNTSAATEPQGTCGSHSATLTLLLARSVDLDAPPALTTCCMFFGDAEANTSAGAPWLICAARSELAPKLSLTLLPGWALSNCLASVVNASFNEAAANTVTVPLTAAP